MSYWKTVYPDITEPAPYSRNERSTLRGRLFVTNVIFHSISGQNGVIYIPESEYETNENTLLVYQTSFLKPYSTEEGGAIKFYGDNCVQVSICSTEAYAEQHGSHSEVGIQQGSKGKNHIIGCSISNTIGEYSAFTTYYGVHDISHTNVSHCIGYEKTAWRISYADSSSAPQKYTTSCNTSCTNTQAVFGYESCENFNVRDSIFILNSNQIGRWGIFYSLSMTLNLDTSIIVDNIGPKLFSPWNEGRINVHDCYINNPKCPSSGANFLSTKDSLTLSFSYFSTQICEANCQQHNFNNVKKQISADYSDEFIFCHFKVFPTNYCKVLACYTPLMNKSKLR